MPSTAVIKCPKCQGLLLAAINTKTKLCPYCGTKIDLLKTKKVAKAESASAASEILKQLKQKQAQNPKKTL